MCDVKKKLATSRSFFYRVEDHVGKFRQEEGLRVSASVCFETHDWHREGLWRRFVADCPYSRIMYCFLPPSFGFGWSYGAQVGRAHV